MCPDHRQHRGAHPDDVSLFAPKMLPALQAATDDLAWLLSRGYAPASSLKLVGDRYNLRERQRVAAARASCGAESRTRRAQTRIGPSEVRDADILIDGFNLLITLEAALGGGVLLDCRDSCLRDLASVHGTYRSVEETDRALLLAGEELARLAPRSVRWLLDSPISNSGMLAGRIRELAARNGWPWTVELPFNPDKVLLDAAPETVIISSDALVLDGVARWYNLAAELITAHIPQAWRVPLNTSPTNV